ncbi:MAG: DNA gyrase C-terminal beta-propeller domain-containing protein, partial [Flavobacteriales bacterium]|nr:DNA gyrase C-terminal beta-propeller domain-containing protein [Flavobacteriales bacterium]
NDHSTDTVMVVSENGYGKRSSVEDYRITNRGGKGVKTLNITDKTGKLIAIKNVIDENDLMIINRSGIAIRMDVSEIRVMGRATQGVKLINLKGSDSIAAVAKVEISEDDEEEVLAAGTENPTTEEATTDNDGNEADDINDSDQPETDNENDQQ